VGVDLNATMVANCRAAGLEVVQADCLEYLRALAPASCAAFTGLHIIEHFPFRSLVSVFDAALQALKPGGVVLFETPNPENLLVGACRFWNDPTHVRPLPPDVMRYVAEARGFTRAEIRPLHPFPEWEQLPAGSQAAVRNLLNKLLYGAQDYSIVAWKP
jgi:O-antigen chain-terminating methyltransferase